jgi:hypothetical protein
MKTPFGQIISVLTISLSIWCPLSHAAPEKDRDIRDANGKLIAHVTVDSSGYETVRASQSQAIVERREHQKNADGTETIVIRDPNGKKLGEEKEKK